MNRQELFTRMVERNAVSFKGMLCLIQAIEMEDGSGESFNLTLKNQEFDTFNVYFRTGTGNSFGAIPTIPNRQVNPYASI